MRVFVCSSNCFLQNVRERDKVLTRSVHISFAVGLEQCFGKYVRIFFFSLVSWHEGHLNIYLRMYKSHRIRFHTKHAQLFIDIYLNNKSTNEIDTNDDINSNLNDIEQMFLLYVCMQHLKSIFLIPVYLFEFIILLLVSFLNIY